MSFRSDKAQELSDRAVQIIRASEDGKLLPRCSADEDAFSCRFPEMNFHELEDHLLRCLEGAQSFIEKRGKEVDHSMINTLAAAGNALIVCRLMRQCCMDYEKERKRRGKLLRLAGRGET